MASTSLPGRRSCDFDRELAQWDCGRSAPMNHARRQQLTTDKVFGDGRSQSELVAEGA
jgi:hypothetical protein